MRELSLNVMDIVQNSISAQADCVKISVQEITAENTLTIVIDDNGKGMTPQQVQSVQDPFFTTRTTRKVGLGVPLFKMAAEQTGGLFKIESEVNVGTKVTASFKTDNVDMTPLGDINSTVSILIRCNPQIDFLFLHSVDDKELKLDTKELRVILEGVPLDSPDVMEWINAYLQEQTEILYGGA